jgi:hypothetical protein
MKYICEKIDTWCAKKGFMLSCSTLDGSMGYVGTLREAYYFYIERGIKPELSTPKNKVCSVGYCKRDGKWYGWSHRAIHGFATRKEAEEFADSVS